MCGALDCDTCHPERNWPRPVTRHLACANEIADQWTHTKHTEGISEIIEQHFSEDVADAERFRWLIKQGLAWRECYDESWLKGEWLYEAQNARAVVDEKRAAATPNDQKLSHGCERLPPTCDRSGNCPA